MCLVATDPEGLDLSLHASTLTPARRSSPPQLGRAYKLNVSELDAHAIEFTPYLWHTLTDHAEVDTDGTITFTFRDGTTNRSTATLTSVEAPLKLSVR